MKLKPELQKNRDQNQQQQELSAHTQKQNKKIRKRHHKKKGKLSKHQQQDHSELMTLLNTIPQYFNKPKHKITHSLRNKLTTHIHIKDVINKEILNCYPTNQQNCDEQVKKFVQLVKFAQISGPIERIGLVSLKNNTRLCLSYLKELKTTTDFKHAQTTRRFLSSNESLMLKKRQELMHQIVTFIYALIQEKGYNAHQVPIDLVEIMTLCKLNAEVQREIGKKIDVIGQRPDYLYNCHLNQSSTLQKKLQNQYISALSIKNLERSFNENPINFYNYHKKNEVYQDNDFIETSFDELQSLSQFKKYALSKKPKNHKGNNYLLRTPCSACFSQLSQMYNPIDNCPECHIRIHQHCQKVQKRCHRCRYGRTSNLEKKQSSFCYVCNREREKGVMILTVTNKAPHQFAHHYCLLLHNLWRSEDQEFVGQYKTPPRQPHKVCVFCLKSQGYFFQCTCCGQGFHGMCAYLAGCSLSMKRGQGRDYKVIITCCTSPELRERLKIQRMFKLNIQKVVFRQDRELFEYIEQKWRHADSEIIQ